MKAVIILFFGIVLFGIFGVFTGSRFLAPEELLSSPLAELRLIRTIGAFVIGGSLALSGLIFQAVLRNPLADPFTLGLSGGAGTGAALAFVLGLTAWTTFAIPACAFAGALTVLAAVLLISRCGARGTESLLLSGVIAGTVTSSILMYLLSAAKNEELAGITWWMLGDLQTPDVRFLLPLGIFDLILIPVLFRFSRSLDVLSLGDERAFYQGLNPRVSGSLLILAASLLTAGTVAISGIIGFCGLIVPHVMRRILGVSHRKNLIQTFLAGGLFLMICDLASRNVFPDREIPIGVLTSVIGGPVFLWILNRRTGHGS